MALICRKCKFNNTNEARFCGKCGETLVFIKDGIIEPGYIVDRRYEIIEALKEGGMGCVYHARDIRLDSECAVKEMLGSEEPDDQIYAINRFAEEALILSKLRHSGLPVVRDYFIENERYYLVMDYIKGEDIETIIENLDGKPMNEDEVIHIAVQILDVLDYLHNQDPPIVYRDLKPGNIMLRERDKKAMLIDFGIARTLKPDSSTTKTSIGTFGYCSMEQVRGKPEPRSDIYSMGATMHHMLTAVQPQLLTIDPLEQVNPDVSRKLTRIVNKSLQENPDKRFSSAREMMEALLSTDDMPAKLMIDEYPDMAYIPAGKFWIGSDGGDPNEYPKHKVFVKPYLIDKCPVTNEQFEKFVKETKSNISQWRRTYKPGMEKYPVVNVSFHEAAKYAEWAGKRLPYEFEWEKAARGADGRKYPWGEQWDDYAIDSSNLTNVGSFPDRASPYGVMDLVGCIYEWTLDWYYPYPYKGPYESGKTKVVRGGKSRFATCSYRGFDIPDYRNPARGFRCVVEL